MIHACACCHAISEVELATCPLCGEATWLELNDEEAEQAKKFVDLAVTVEEVRDIQPWHTPVTRRPAKRKESTGNGPSAARQAIEEMRKRRNGNGAS